MAAHRGGRGERAHAHSRRVHGAERADPADATTARSRSAPGRAIFFCEFDGPRERSVLRQRAPVAQRRSPLPAPSWPHRSTTVRRSSSTSTRSPTAATASRASTGSSSSFAVACPVTRSGRASTKVKRGFAEATALEILAPGPDRVEAPCPHFGACGGCRFQDYAYERQLEAKAAQVRDALVRLGGIADPPLEPIVPAASQYGYRNKLEYSFTQTEDGPALGFHRAGRWDEVLALDDVPADDRPRQRDPRCGAGVGARGEARGLRPGHPVAAISATSSCARAGTRGRCSCSSSRPRGGSSRRATCRGAAAVPRGAVDPLGGQRHARRGDEPADACCSGVRMRSRRRSSGCASACGRTPSCRRTPRWPRRCTRSRASSPG